MRRVTSLVLALSLSTFMVVFAPSTIAIASSECDHSNQWLDSCGNTIGAGGEHDATAEGDRVDVSASHSGSSTGSEAGTGSTGNSESAAPGNTAGAPSSTSGASPAPIYIPPLGDNGFGDYDIDCVIGAAGHCIDRYIPDLPPADPADGVDADTDGAVTVVTISDIASFSPITAAHFMQPDGWIVVGLPTNFYAQIDTHVVSGTLLGEPADVRFTPRAYSWSYGDGNTALLGTPGNSWQALGVAEFDPTATSHIYTSEGTYVIELTVLYTAEYRWAGGPWTPIAGHVEVPANRLVAQATSDAVTVLVDRDCTRAPVGPGC